jgi:autotransporter-associated beta strand protein
LTTGSYTLLTANGGITAGSTINGTPIGNGIVASGYGGTIAISGNTVVLNVVQLGVSDTWTDGLSDQNWSELGNWSGGGTVPHSPGDAAIFGTGGAGLGVNLNVPETVGGITFNNSGPYVITGANTLTLDNKNSGPAIQVNGGTANSINTVIALNGNLTVTINPGYSLTLGGSLANESVPETIGANGGGTLILSSANNYGPAVAGTFGTLLSGATLQVGSSAALGAGDVNVTANSTLQAGAASLNLFNNLAVAGGHTLTVNNNGDVLTLGGVISGAGAITATGSGTLILSGANNLYSGITTINAGIVSIAGDGATAGGSGSLGLVPASFAANDVILNGGDLFASTSLTLNANRGIGIGSASNASTNWTTAFVDAASGQILTLPGIIASAGNIGLNNLTVNSGPGNNGTVVLGGANTLNGTNVIANGSEQLANALALQDATLYYNNQGGVLDFGTQVVVTLGGLQGSQNLSLVNDSDAPVTLSFGSTGLPSPSTVYTGILSDGGLGGSVDKLGSGSITIGQGAAGGATYSGTTTVDAGTLTLGGVTSINSSGALGISGTWAVCNLIFADNAVATFSGAINLGYGGVAGSPGGGSGYPLQANLTVEGNASVSAASLSFGEDKGRVASGSSVTVQNNASLFITGSFDLDDLLNGTSSSTSTSLTLNGGNTTVGNFIATDGSTTKLSTINLNGGVLSANNSDPGGSSFLPALTGLTVNVLTNGAIINPTNFDITIAAVFAGAGGLTNIGPGVLNLAAANTYAGATTIANGATLNVINTSGSGTSTNIVTVLNGGTLGGTGTILGNVLINSGGTLGGSETIYGSLVLEQGALATFNVGNTPTPLHASVVAMNNNIATINVNGNALDVGVYPLLTYSTSGSTGVFNPTPVFTGSGLAYGTQASITTSHGVVALVVSFNVPVGDVWVSGNGNWTTPTDWSSNPTVPGNPSDNPGDAATLGVGALSGVTTLTLNANESLSFLTLTNANSFVIANAGHTLTLNNNGGGSVIAVSGGSTNVIQTAVALGDNTTVSVNNGDLLAVSGVVANGSSGSETLTLAGEGELILANANTYGPAPGSTGTTIGGGTLQVGNNHALSTGDVSFTGNGALQAGADGLVVTNNLSVASGVNALLNDGGHAFTLGGIINGSGAVQKIGGGSLTLTNNNGFGGGLEISSGTLVLAGANSGGSGLITNDATLQLANVGAIGNTLQLDSGSTLQLRSDTGVTFSPGGLALQNAADTLTFDVGPVTSGVTDQTLTLSGALDFTDGADQTITVTGNSTYNLALGDITLTSGSHTPFFNLFVNTLPTGPSVTLSSVTFGNWGNDLDVDGGGNVTIAGNLTATSNGEIDLFVNDGTTVTLQGLSVGNSTASDGDRYVVADGTLVLDNNNALVNNTDGTGLDQSVFILGAATNIISGSGYTHEDGVLTATNNSFNAAVYLGDANNLSGGLSVPANLTNNVSDGDVGFTNSGVFTIGGQNTSGVNTYQNPIILGWTPNVGKGVTLVAATGGEVDFTGGILANGSDTTAGITVGNAGFAGVVKLAGTNTYGGPTIVNKGTLALSNENGPDAYIGNSGSIVINAGAILDVTGQSSGTLPLGTGLVPQTISGAGSVNGTLTVGSLGTVAPGSAATTGVLTVSSSATLGGATVLKLNNAGSPTSDELASLAITAGGTLTVTNIGPALVAGSTFHLFSKAVAGFTAITLPVADHNYKYTWTTNLAVNGTITLAAATPLVNTNAATANFRAVPVGNTLKFTWAPDHQGWQLYTNSVGLTAPGSWFPQAGTAAGTNATITVNPAQPQVFFQLRYP